MMTLQFIQQPESSFRLGDFLQKSLTESGWTEFRAAIAFVKKSGTKHIQNALSEFSRRAAVSLSVGIDAGGTSVEGLTSLLDAIQDRGDIWIFHNAGNFTFHPKVYLFKNQDQAQLVIGSGNLTEGGLFTNYEANVRLELDLSKSDHVAFLAAVESTLDDWSKAQEGLCYALTHGFLQTLETQRYILPESQTLVTEPIEHHQTEKSESGLFNHVKIPSAPKVLDDKKISVEQNVEPEETGSLPFNKREPVELQTRIRRVFLMTLQRTDVGIGQIGQGTSRRSPEIFIPLAARAYDPLFWGWPDSFIEDPEKPGKWDRRHVNMRIGTEIVNVNMMTWPDKSDFRLRCEALRSAGNIGDMLYLERGNGHSEFSYYVEIIPNGTLRYTEYLVKCDHSVRNSAKRWGYIAG